MAQLSLFWWYKNPTSSSSSFVMRDFWNTVKYHGERERERSWPSAAIDHLVTWIRAWKGRTHTKRRKKTQKGLNKKKNSLGKLLWGIRKKGKMHSVLRAIHSILETHLLHFRMRTNTKIWFSRPQNVSDLLVILRSFLFMNRLRY